MEKIVLIGGNTIDYIATSKNKLIKKTSNIGSLSISLGGVMRNICVNLANLGMKCYFFTCIGSDLYGKMMKDDLNKHNIDVLSPKIDNFNNASYICINDSNHDIEDAIIDNEIMKELTFDFLLDNKNVFDKSSYLVMDTNLDEEEIDNIFDEFKDKKIIVEAISRSKVNRIKAHLKVKWDPNVGHTNRRVFFTRYTKEFKLNCVKNIRLVSLYQTLAVANIKLFIKSKDTGSY